MPLPSYRIEHHEPHRTRVMATLSDIQPHPRGLDVFVSQLLQHGKQGWVRLVDETTGRVVARRRIAAPTGTPYRS